MRRQLVARLGQSLIVVMLVTTISFFIIHLAPGDPFSYDGHNLSPEIRDHWRQQFGYDRPLVEQYVRYLTSVAHGQFGYSHSLQTPVTKALAIALPRTLLLTGLSLVLSFLAGMLIGVAQAVRRGTWFDRISSAVLLFFYSLPDFWLAIMMLLAFAYWLPVLPASGIVDDVMHPYMGTAAAIVDRLKHLILPVTTLTLLTTAGLARFQRAAMLDVLPMDFIRTARAKGASERSVIWHHALRTALTPLVTLLGLLFPALVGGALFVERVFAWPGMGFYAAKAIAQRDYDLVTATVVIGAVMVAVGNLLADVLHAALDPRVRE